MLTSAGAPVLPLLRLLARWPDACYAALAEGPRGKSCSCWLISRQARGFGEVVVLKRATQ